MVGYFSDDDIHRIQALQRDMQQADQNAAAMMSSASAPAQYGQHTTPHSQYPPQPSQYPHSKLAHTTLSDRIDEIQKLNKGINQLHKSHHGL